MKLTSENVRTAFTNCLFKENEPTGNQIAVEGVMMKVGFHPERLAETKPVIADLLKNLPNSFQKSGGGGMSFLNMCEDKDGELWTGFHQSMDELVCLGVATGTMSFLMPREMWSILPGGMPYLIVN